VFSEELIERLYDFEVEQIVVPGAVNRVESLWVFARENSCLPVSIGIA